MSLLKTISAFSLLLLASCGGNSGSRNSETKMKIPVDAVQVRKTVISTGDSYVGQVEEYRYSSLAFKVGGELKSVNYTEGDIVHEGAVLATLDTASLYDSYRIAASTLRQAKDGYERMKLLHDAGTLPDVQWVDIKTKLEKAESAERLAARNLDDSRLRAPYDGVVSMRKCGEGELAVPGETVFRIVDLDRLYVKISVPEKEIDAIDGQNVVVTVPALDDRVYYGKVDVKGIKANPLTHTYEVKALLDNPGRRMLPGMLVNVFVEKNVHDGFSLPVGAVAISNDGRKYVWTVSDDSTAVMKFVRTGALQNDSVEICEGLSEGDFVIVGGGHKVSNGMSVDVRINGAE